LTSLGGDTSVSLLSSYSLQCCNTNNCNYQSSNNQVNSNTNQISSSVISCYYGSVISGDIPNFYPYTPTKQSCSSIESSDTSGSDYCAVIYIFIKNST
jgi:hypothetical protein